MSNKVRCPDCGKENELSFGTCECSGCHKRYGLCKKCGKIFDASGGLSATCPECRGAAAAAASDGTFVGWLDAKIMNSNHNLEMHLLRLFVAIPILKPLKLRRKEGIAWWFGTLWLTFYVGAILTLVISGVFKPEGEYPDVCSGVMGWSASFFLFLAPRVISLIIRSSSNKAKIVTASIFLLDIIAIAIAYQFSFGAWVDGIFKPTYYDYRSLSENEWNEVRSVSKSVNNQLEKWREDKNLTTSDQGSSKNWEEQYISYVSYVGETEYDAEKKLYKLSKEISVTLRKEFAGCPAGAKYVENITYASKKNKAFDQVVNSKQHIEIQGVKSKNKKLVMVGDCWQLLEVGAEYAEILSSTPRQETLYLLDQQWSTPSSFNPLAESWMVSWPVAGRNNLMYEPLLVYNSLNDSVESLLGSLVKDLSNNDSIVVALNPAAKWSDGRLLSSEDVLFSYLDCGRDVSNIISQINVLNESNGRTYISFVVAKEKFNNPLKVYELLQYVHIVPAHIFKPLIAKKGLKEAKKLVMSENPVVSGPYNLKEFADDKIVLKRRDDYWGNVAIHNGKLPAPQYIVHPIFNGNGQGIFAMREGNLDISSLYIPHVWNKERQGIHAWLKKEPYYTPLTMPMLIINTQKYPLSDRRFRRALAAAIDYAGLGMLSMSNYTSSIRPGLIIPDGVEKKYYEESDEKYGVMLDNANRIKRKKMVKRMFTEAGYSSEFSRDGELVGMYNSNGEKMPTLYITCPYGWSDWESMVSIAVENMREAGIDVQENFVDGGSYWPAMGLGNFDLIMHKPAGDASPAMLWNRFNEVMSSQNWKPVGEWAGVNVGRYNQPDTLNFRPEIDRLLSEIPLMTDLKEKTRAYGELNRIFMEDQPAIPLAYVPENYYDYSDKVWTNWPNAQSPYAPPQLPGYGAGTNILWNISLK
ncbi:ABC-type transport system, substrate-binding protein [Fibrobacter sp. UWT2]|uniref:ABC transporter substrate-binding protein n=1 Tax=Fibrobacter sp. UWT2 TaxID=1896224 RepID=UPI000915582D|nr:ABC transporter substrate-binding protein [Fibrobacter sp. UWT2]SHL06657.1 ABC-type transport system, substrate-binding protein [Fibrobacter sp. UWT2]